eukprot:CAMPEP_0197651272 /NCGR_PEP_ID=MMETSP1338-20131121/31774_1 /TAXON_ID=43686 ORGANISM="Pelagodinium beii, Strain RCC1491" /NCGR_SAMPLE_ID=MMETSP1338 /ASSEMBLY_ACC=CAM_ASM_000754 /LENGTH=158 /DNA_ID=CAMNT_0043225859 /DNA_START=127 /DNA_END=603 /DNA_ORIENTATION=-
MTKVPNSPVTPMRPSTDRPVFGRAATPVVGGRGRAHLTQRRLRLAGNEMPRNMNVGYGMAGSILGIGLYTAFKICRDTGIDPNKRFNTLEEDEEIRLADEIKKYFIESPLRRVIKSNINHLLDIQHERGRRMKVGLTTRYQRTKKRSNVARKLNPSRF